MRDIAGNLAAHRELFRIGDAVDPDRLGAEEPADGNRDDPRRGTGRDDHIGTVFRNNAQDLPGRLDVP